MNKLLKKVLIGFGVLVLLIGIGLLILVLSVNAIAKAGIEKGGTWAMGVPTRIDSISIGLFSGTAEMNGLNIANPQGFKSDHFLKMGHSKVAVTIGSVISGDTIELPELTIENLSVRLDKNAQGANYRVIMDNIAKAQGPVDPNKKADEGGGKKVIIKKLTLKNISIGADLIGAPGAVGEALTAASHQDVVLDKIELTNVGQTGQGVAGSGVTFGQLTGIMVQAILSAAANKAGSLLPGDITGDLQKGLGGLKDLGSMGIGVAEGGAKLLADVGKGAAEAVGDGAKKLGEGVGEGVKGIGEGLKNINPFGGGDKK